jgi:hypothetical protein
MSGPKPMKMEDLIDRLLLISTLNSTLVHFLLSSQVEGYVDPDRVDSLRQGLTRTRKWMEDATVSDEIPASTANIMGLIVKRLSQIESILPKLSEKAKKAETVGPTQEILSLLEGGEPSTPVSKTEGTAMEIPTDSSGEEIVPLVTAPEQEEPEEAFHKVDVEDDEFGLIGQSERMIKQYSKRCHVLLPTFWLEVLRELHRYRSKSPYFGDILEMPSRVIHAIIKGLLSEAPGARLLQDLSKKRPPENFLDASEQERIERAVARYFTSLEGLLNGDIPDIEDRISDAQIAYQGFEWGGADLEKRIIKRLNQQAEESLQNAQESNDDERKVIYAEITKLLCKLQLGILAEPRLREILAQMKP